ncbi:MAG TPA: phosphate acyltransferase, partial [Kofleriaceae bacterium]|nr:phosphate acyltransferase [Kofleriaceae bacterium]
VPDAVINAYGGKTFKFGPEYFIPKPFDPRVLWWVAPAVAMAAIDSGVARVPVDIEEYRERLRRKGSNAAYSIMRGMVRTAKQDPKRIVFPEASNPKLLRALQIIVDEGIARPVLLGRREEIENGCRELDLDLLGRGVTLIDPRDPKLVDKYAQRFWEMRQRKGVTLAAARASLARSNYFGMMMLAMDEVDGLVSGLKLTYPDTLRPALQILGLQPGCRVATGMYMMVLKNSVKFFADATINIEPDAQQLADIAIQVSDAVGGFGVTPRVAMVSFSNFGSVKHPESQLVEAALALVRAARPELEIDGPMQADYALEPDRRNDLYPFSSLTSTANVLVFPTLSAANSAYKVLSVLGNAQPVGPILLGLAKPVTVLQNEASVEDIVNMAAYTVKVAQTRVR